MRSPWVLAAACLLGCGPPRQQSAFFSFEGSLQGWAQQALDVGAGAWSVTTDPGFPFDGTSSARFSIDNVNGTGKIWLERTFALTSSGRHRVHIDFAALGSADPAAPDRLIVGVLPAPPRNADQLQPALQPPGIAGTQWTQHGYDFEVGGAVATVVVGVAGAVPGRILYHLDALTVLFADAP